ncbi:hypothetical protein Bbelb_153540 [Branchiostoma belcheri]|nr:hypothetical protein Bbelb_153540 [Branchiostoma belcheri]
MVQGCQCDGLQAGTSGTEESQERPAYTCQFLGSRSNMTPRKYAPAPSESQEQSQERDVVWPGCQTVSRDYTCQFLGSRTYQGQFLGSRANMQGNKNVMRSSSLGARLFPGLTRASSSPPGPTCKETRTAHTCQFLGSRANMQGNKNVMRSSSLGARLFPGLTRASSSAPGPTCKETRTAHTFQFLGSRANMQGNKNVMRSSSLDVRLSPGSTLSVPRLQGYHVPKETRT